MGVSSRIGGGSSFSSHRWNPPGILLVTALLITATPLGLAAERPRIVFTRNAPAHSGLFLADADGKNERPLLPATSLDYNASFSADGKWVIFTSERGGSADIYRVHPDGTGVERLTEGPSYDDQAALSPDGRTLAFVSTRGGGTANIWLLDLASQSVHECNKERERQFSSELVPRRQVDRIQFRSRHEARPGYALMGLASVDRHLPCSPGRHRTAPLDGPWRIRRQPTMVSRRPAHRLLPIDSPRRLVQTNISGTHWILTDRFDRC